MKWDDFVKDFAKLANKALDEVSDKDAMDDIGGELVEDIKKRTRLGQGVDKSLGRQSKFKPLAASTKKSRGYKSKRGELKGRTTPAKSNLTETGDMLNSLDHKASKGNVTVDVSSKEADKAEYVSEDRPFMNISKAQDRKIKKKIEEDLAKQLKKLIK